jgi:hypothetical protein
MCINLSPKDILTITLDLFAAAGLAFSLKDIHENHSAVPKYPINKTYLDNARNTNRCTETCS